MGKKYNVFNGGEPERTHYEYKVGEVITVYGCNETYPAKCVKKETVDGDIYHYWRRGVMKVVF
ncbi:hypothetical protein AVV02_gp195 [Bacillus phage AvesoBmore]|uniref:Uncharacterized protein n=1 Tax=Bacillus phage AvesoBmore TaxID=1698451 RepID=A0A0K2D0K7_9CAUD|nr:hypothetical protein AVV02_gp195 [Bacillus phage AvesoBmore]ALA13359.1 hypothetical protein AVESOBMORE_195 [Bacillus phage AvesoBmore]